MDSIWECTLGTQAETVWTTLAYLRDVISYTVENNFDYDFASSVADAVAIYTNYEDGAKELVCYKK